MLSLGFTNTTSRLSHRVRLSGQALKHLSSVKPLRCPAVQWKLSYALSNAAVEVFPWSQETDFELFIKDNKQDNSISFKTMGALNSISVSEMLSHCTPSSFMNLQNNKELVDESIRKAVEFPGRDLVIKSKRGLEFDEILVRRLSKYLFSKSPEQMTLHLNKLSIYSAGGHFKTHKDSDQLDPDNFLGTLVVCLPSAFEGGDLILHGGDKNKILNFAEHSSDKNKIQYVAVGAGCEHEVKPVTSGNRVVLTYTILRDVKDITNHAKMVPIEMPCNISGLRREGDRLCDGSFRGRRPHSPDTAGFKEFVNYFRSRNEEDNNTVPLEVVPNVGHFASGDKSAEDGSYRGRLPSSKASRVQPTNGTILVDRVDDALEDGSLRGVTDIQPVGGVLEDGSFRGAAKDPKDEDRH